MTEKKYRKISNQSIVVGGVFFAGGVFIGLIGRELIRSFLKNAKQTAREIDRMVGPETPEYQTDVLVRDLRNAIDQERYLDAAVLRDKIYLNIKTSE